MEAAFAGTFTTLQRCAAPSYWRPIEPFVVMVMALPVVVMILFSAAEVASWLAKDMLEAEILIILMNLPSVPPAKPEKAAVPKPLYLNNPPELIATSFCVPVVTNSVPSGVEKSPMIDKLPDKIVLPENVLLPAIVWVPVVIKPRAVSEASGMLRVWTLVAELQAASVPEVPIAKVWEAPDWPLRLEIVVPLPTLTQAVPL